jgi:type III pantothenate kinase
MILVVDIGNTNIVVGCIEGQKTYFIERMATDKRRTELEYAISLKNVLELYDIRVEDLDGGIISSVVPSLTKCVQCAAEKLLRRKVKVVGPGLKNGLKIKTDNPAQLGSDQVVNAVAALAEYAPPLLIIDMGTATTVSVINREGSYIGCLIMPGLKIALESLVNSTAQLTQVSLETPKRLIGSNTIDCMKSGALYGHAAAIDGLINRIEEELGEKCTVVATGGLSSLVVPLCKRQMILEDDLLLKGLQIIYNKNL